MVKRLGLGKGLSALIPEGANEEQKFVELAIQQIVPNPDQPRHQFDATKLEELAQSIRANGVIQPLVVTKRGSQYVLIAGERRWRAAQLAGFDKIPAVIRDTPEGEMLTLALIENIQRQELNPVEEALAYKNLIEKNGFTQETLATQLGKSRTTISNTVRLLKLPQNVQDMIEDGSLSFGHAKCLMGLSGNERIDQMAQKCVQNQWSVRELERQLIKESKPKANKQEQAQNIFVEKAALAMSRSVGSKIVIRGTEKRGKVVIPYKNHEQLQRIFESLTNQASLEE
ncbi:MAG: ParB/RepB/Spo0J family partition protein [Acidobacteria bacterium]|nr:ParB/RepB/Spo0J family partition protein [Acidobacteriota bacterium]MCB9396270.1 ParB/RepB/Spo0J family partition protein [Acidobacteriota bacterium]